MAPPALQRFRWTRSSDTEALAALAARVTERIGEAATLSEVQTTSDGLVVGLCWRTEAVDVHLGRGSTAYLVAMPAWSYFLQHVEGAIVDLGGELRSYQDDQVRPQRIRAAYDRPWRDLPVHRRLMLSQRLRTVALVASIGLAVLVMPFVLSWQWWQRRRRSRR